MSREVDGRFAIENNSDMGRLAGTSVLLGIFLATVLCALVCPGHELQSANRMCKRGGHSCCPNSNDVPAKDQCVDTHFMATGKYHPAALELTPFIVDDVPVTAALNPIIPFRMGAEPFTGPPLDLLARQILRI